MLNFVANVYRSSQCRTLSLRRVAQRGRVGCYGYTSTTQENVQFPRNKDADIVVFNSLTRTKVPLDIEPGRHFTWYMCGPTVYDSMHLGHACTYIKFDVIRRVLTNHFKVPVLQVMGITDIDDKIIARAKERNTTVKSIARHYEVEFMQDMKTLGCDPPTSLTRVSDYLVEISTFIEKLVEQGFAYEVQEGRYTSVYFDVARYGDRYGVLAPEKRHQDTYKQEDTPSTTKRDVRDFALWKAITDPTETANIDDMCWLSRWGLGRPGWHIECSAMSCSVFGPKLDLHTGGIDLKFPHHENEIAQCEALHGVEWAKCFLHSGHLHIDGMKMSKSLKNFTTVRVYLETYTPLQLRLACLMTRYNAPMNYSDDMMTQALNIESRFKAFIHDTAELELSQAPNGKWGQSEADLMNSLNYIRTKVNERLRDDFDTPGVMHRLLELVSIVQKYNNNVSRNQTPSIVEGVRVVSQYIQNTLNLFGVEFTSRRQYTSNDSDSDTTEVINAFVQFRSDVRAMSIAALKDNSDTKAAHHDLLAKCDEVRDNTLSALGITLKDSSGGCSWRRADPKLYRQAIKRESESFSESQAALSFTDENVYSQYCERGIPTHDASGELLSKRLRKKLVKRYEKSEQRRVQKL